MTGKTEVINGIYYLTIYYKDSLNRHRRTRIKTDLPERGNKKAAEKLLKEKLENFDIAEYESVSSESIVDKSILFIDYIERYVLNKKKELSPAAYYSYDQCVKVMKEYFGNKLLLKDVTYHHIEDFYDYLKNERKNTNTTIKHYAVILSPALRKAYRDDLIPKNPYEFMPKLKREKHKTEFYNKEELETLFSFTDKTRLGLIVRVAAFYGFRRSELLGLKWKSIDFDKKIITVENKILRINGQLYQSEKLKTDASLRSLPLLPKIEELLLKRKEEIEHNKKIYGKSYIHNFDEYVFVDDYGDIIFPDWVTNNFRLLLKRNKLKHIRFHDLRHSCASLLLANDVPMKNIQEWLGHANYSTTADVYSHLDFSSKIRSGDIIGAQLSESAYKAALNKQDLELEIKRLNRLLEEKQALLDKQKANDSGME